MDVLPGTDTIVKRKQGELVGKQSLLMKIGRVKVWEVSYAKLYHRAANPSKLEPPSPRTCYHVGKINFVA